MMVVILFKLTREKWLLYAILISKHMMIFSSSFVAIVILSISLNALFIFQSIPSLFLNLDQNVMPYFIDTSIHSNNECGSQRDNFNDERKFGQSS